MYNNFSRKYVDGWINNYCLWQFTDSLRILFILKNVISSVLLFSEYHCKQELNNIPSKIMYVFTWSIQIKNRQIASWHLNILDDGYNSLLFSFQQRRKGIRHILPVNNKSRYYIQSCHPLSYLPRLTVFILTTCTNYKNISPNNLFHH